MNSGVADVICRICTCKGPEMKSIFNLERFSDTQLEICEVITTCASVQIRIDDGLPQYICLKCSSDLHQAFVFKRRCEDSDWRLRNCDKSNEPECDDVKHELLIKTESEMITNLSDEPELTIKKERYESAEAEPMFVDVNNINTNSTIPEEMDEQVLNTARYNLLTAKSQVRYGRHYKDFKGWCLETGSDIVTEEALLVYFLMRSEKLKSPSSLWSEYSMLKSTLLMHDNHDIAKYPKLKEFLKLKNLNNRPKISSIFTRDDMDIFLLEASDDTYLLMKVVMIMGISGACRNNELCRITMSNVEDKNSVIIVTILDSTIGMRRSFTIINRDETHIDFLGFIRKYIDARPKHTTNLRFFMKYQSGKCVNQPVGKNTFSKFPVQIAEFLKLENPTAYTGHSFRRTSATFLADAGIDLLGSKRTARKSNT